MTEYVRTMYGTLFYDKVINGASKYQNDCQPSEATCSTVSSASGTGIAAQLRTGSVMVPAIAAAALLYFARLHGV